VKDYRVADKIVNMMPANRDVFTSFMGIKKTDEISKMYAGKQGMLN
jgi:hypothetical protein